MSTDQACVSSRANQFLYSQRLMAILSTGLEKLSHFPLAPTGSRGGALNGTAVDLNDYEGDIVVILDVENGGTSTLDVKLRSSDTQVGNYTDVTSVFNLDGTEQASAAVAFAQVTTSASKQYLAFPKDSAKRWVKAVSTTGGVHTYSVNAFGAKKYA
jgi:hypothetical protein